MPALLLCTRPTWIYKTQVSFQFIFHQISPDRYVPAYCWLRALKHAPVVAASKILPSRHQSTETSTTVLLAVLVLFDGSTSIVIVHHLPFWGRPLTLQSSAPLLGKRAAFRSKFFLIRKSHPRYLCPTACTNPRPALGVPGASGPPQVLPSRL